MTKEGISSRAWKEEREEGRGDSPNSDGNGGTLVVVALDLLYLLAKGDKVTTELLGGVVGEARGAATVQ